jgi:hypothetical protein
LKKATVILVTILAVVLTAPAMAQSSKAGATYAQGLYLNSDTESLNTWIDAPGMATTVRAPNWKELTMDISLQCGSYTRVKTKGKGGSEDSTSAGAQVIVRAMIQPEGGAEMLAAPGEVVFCGQQLTLTTKLGGIIENLAACTGPEASEDCLLSDEEIEIGLRTLGAHSYNFFYEDLPVSDDYNVRVQVMLDTCVGSVADDFGNCVDGSDPDAEAEAFIVGGSMVVEEVRFTK